MSSVQKLYKKKKNSQEINELSNIFSAQPIEIKQTKKEIELFKEKLDNQTEMEIEQQLGDKDIEKALQQELSDNGEQNDEEQQEQNPFTNEDLSMKQKLDRDERTIFIGNVPLATSKKDIVKIFKKYGKIENIRERSVPVKQSKDMPIKARVILKKHTDGNEDNQVKNCYILYENKESAEKSLEKNGLEYKGNNLRVDLASKKELDFDQTIFVGNLNYNINENQLRQHFQKCGAIVNVRVIRDKETHVGKGFGYVQFGEIEGFKAALELKGSKLDNRILRIKKAVPKARLEKKQKKKVEQRKQNENGAIRRIKEKEQKGQEEIKNRKQQQRQQQEDRVNLKSKAAKDFVEGDLDNIEEVDIKNNIVIPPRLLRKQIKKSKKRGEDQNQQFKKAQLTQKKFHERNDRNIFNGQQGLKDRKDKREKRRQQNRKKVKDQIINE